MQFTLNLRDVTLRPPRLRLRLSAECRLLSATLIDMLRRQTVGIILIVLVLLVLILLRFHGGAWRQF